ncbi:MAG: ATP synthase F1 subunit delta [Chlorobi bacterium]|nr:ATP synthase F1 subunit delta [Chlorobiota bacterium]
MNTNRITVRYAKALYSFAENEKKAEAVRNDMQLTAELINIAEFRNMLKNPVIFPSKKIAVFNKLLEGKVSNLTLTFFKLLANNKREAYLDAISRNYIDFYRKQNNIKSAKLTTVFTADEKLKKEIITILAKQFKADIELVGETDKNITGGFVLTVDGKQYDASISSKLKELKKEMLNT